jgi:membrane-bound lytic murein transglycosylase
MNENIVDQYITRSRVLRYRVSRQAKRETSGKRQQTTNMRQQTADTRQYTAETRQQTANRRQQTAKRRQQTANTRQQTSNTRQQTANTRQRTENSTMPAKVAHKKCRASVHTIAYHFVLSRNRGNRETGSWQLGHGERSEQLSDSVSRGSES